MTYYASILIAALAALLITTRRLKGQEIRFWWRWVRVHFVIACLSLLTLMLALGAGGRYLVDHYIEIHTGWLARGLVAGALAAALLRVDTAAFDLAGAAPGRSAAVIILHWLDELVRSTERDAVKRYVQKLTVAEARALAVEIFECDIRGTAAEATSEAFLVESTIELDEGDTDAEFRIKGWCIRVIHEHRIIVRRDA